MNVPLPMVLPCQSLCCCWGEEGWQQKGRNLASLIPESTSLLCQIPGASCPPHWTGKQHWYCYPIHPIVRVVPPPDGSLQENTSAGMCPFHLDPYHLKGTTAERSERALRGISEMTRSTFSPGRLRCRGFLRCLGRRYPQSESSLGVGCMVLSAWYTKASVTHITLRTGGLLVLASLWWFSGSSSKARLVFSWSTKLMSVHKPKILK